MTSNIGSFDTTSSSGMGTTRGQYGSSDPATSSYATGTAEPQNVAHDGTVPHSASHSADTGESVANKAKGVAAGIHGFGEKIRGTFNAGVDEFNPNDKHGAKTVNQSRNEAITAQGDSEIHTGRFSQNTKEKEGVLPGNGI